MASTNTSRRTRQIGFPAKNRIARFGLQSSCGMRSISFHNIGILDLEERGFQEIMNVAGAQEPTAI
jgi:hypothetical protein